MACCAAAALAGLHLLWLVCMLGAHATLACHDQTTYESIRGTQTGAPSLGNCRRSLCPSVTVEPQRGEGLV